MDSTSLTNNRINQIVICIGGVLLALFLLPQCLFASATKEATIPFQFRQYHIKASLSFETDASITASFRKHTLQSVEQTIQRTIGKVWDVQIVENQQLLPASKVGLNRLQEDAIQQSLSQFEADDFLDGTLLIKQLIATNKTHTALLEKAEQSRTKKVSRKLTPVENIWVSLSEELRADILDTGQKESGTDTLLPKIQKEFNLLLASTQLIRKSGSEPGGTLAVANRDQIIAAFPNVFYKQRYGKQMFVTVQRKGKGFLLSGREWDETAHRLSLVQQSQVVSRRSLGIGIVRLMTHLFHPRLEILSVENDDITLQMQGGGFIIPDPAAQLLQPGDHLEPFLRYLDRRHIVQKVQFLSYTYLQVETVGKNRVTCKLISGIRSPLGTGRRRRVESLALGIKLVSNHTRLKLMPRKGIKNPLVGYRVTVVTSKEKESKTPPVHLISSREGEVVIPTHSSHQLLWLFIRSGKALLARIPFIPGQHQYETIPLGNDATRLRVEGEVAILKGDLVDLIARREITISRARNFANPKNGKKSQPKKVQEMLDILKGLPDLKEFQDRLNRIQTLSLAEADKQGNRIAKSRIRSLCRDAGELIKKFLDNDKIKEFDEEMEGSGDMKKKR